MLYVKKAKFSCWTEESRDVMEQLFIYLINFVSADSANFDYQRQEL